MNALLFLACSVCMGGNDSSTGPATNGAIFVLLGAVGAMLGLVSSVAWNITHRPPPPPEP